MAASDPPAPPSPALARAMGRGTLTALVINGIIGSAIFGLPATVGQLLGPAAPWAYLIAALAVGAIVAVFAELASQFRTSGGQYLWARVALGRHAGIQIGWFSWLVRLTTAAAVTNIFVTYLGEFWPGSAAPLARAAIIIAVIGGLTALNFRGVRQGAGITVFFTYAKLLPLVGFIVAGMWLSTRATGAPLATAPSSGMWIDALVALMFAFGGFEAAVIPAAEAKNPRRDAVFALFTGLAVVTVVYVGVHLVVMWSVPDLATSQRPLADAARAFAGPLGASAIAVGALLSTFGWLSGAFVTVPRLTYALAENGDFPRSFCAVHPRFRTPYISILAWALLVLALALYGSFLWNALLSVAARLVTYGASCIALIQLRRQQPAADAWRAPAGIVLALAGLAFCVLLVFRMNTGHAIIISAVALIGLVHWLLVRHGRPLVAAAAAQPP